MKLWIYAVEDARAAGRPIGDVTGRDETPLLSFHRTSGESIDVSLRNTIAIIASAENSTFAGGLLFVRRQRLNSNEACQHLHAAIRGTWIPSNHWC